VPYRDLWDFKPPGIYLAYALAQALFGPSMVSVRVLEVIGLGVMTFAFTRLARAFFGETVIGLVAGALAALVHAQLEFWHTGQPETFGGVLTVLALWCAVKARDAGDADARTATRFMIAVGLLFGCTFLLKPPLAGGAVVSAAYLARASTGGRPAWAPWKPFVVVGLSSAVPIALCGAWFWARGAWPALSWTLFEFVPGYSAINRDESALSAFYYSFEEAFAGFSALLAAGCFATFVLPPMHGREREGVFLFLGVVVMNVVGVAMQAKYFQYHYAAALPLIAFIAAVGSYKVFRRALAAGTPGVVAFVFAIWALSVMRTAVRSNPGTFWERSASRFGFLLNRDRALLDDTLYYVADFNFGADRDVAAVVAEIVPPDRPIFVWGFEPVIYWLSQRAPASRYIYNVPQRTDWERERARRELLSELGARPPAAIIVEHNDVFFHVTGNRLDSAAALSTFPELTALLDARYSLARTVGKFDVYVQK
jgi:hypothetical protein